MKRQRAIRITIATIVLLIGLPVISIGEGITSVRADRNSISLRAESSSFACRFAELRSHQASSSTNFTVVARTNSISPFRIEVPRFDGLRDRLFSSFLALREMPDGTVTPLGTNHFVEAMEGVSEFTTPFPTAASKKGLQVQMVDDALALGVKQAALNVNLTSLVDLKGDTNNPSWQVDGHTVHFRKGPLGALDRQIKPLADANVVIALILLTYASGNPALDQVMLHPSYDKTAPNHLGNFNTVTEKGALYFRACIEFLAQRYSDPGIYRGRVANFILGNEVNSHWFWANMGRVSMETFADDYLRTARVANTALRKVSSSARLYLSLEHHWNIRYPGGDAAQAFPGRAFLDYFNRRAKEQGDFDWHVAFHPYPENLFEPRTWKDKSATTNDDTPRITFKNLELLPRYLRRREMLYHGQARHIILSEQGFHTVNKPDGELWQAAAYAYAYYKTAHLPDIDAFILHRHVDHAAEGGLNLGLWTRKKDSRSAAEPLAKKRIYEVFRAADTADWQQAFEFALPVIGIRQWEEVLSARWGESPLEP